MADISRAMQTPPPAAAPAPQPAPLPASPTQRASADNAARDAKNERDRLRRKVKRAADAKAAKLAAAKPKKKKAKRPPKAYQKQAAKKVDAQYAKKRGRGRPPGAKNKPKVGLAVALVPAPGVLPRTIGKSPLLAAPYGSGDLAAIHSCVNMLNAMPEHARKVVLDAVK